MLSIRDAGPLSFAGDFTIGVFLGAADIGWGGGWFSKLRRRAVYSEEALLSLVPSLRFQVLRLFAVRVIEFSGWFAELIMSIASLLLLLLILGLAGSRLAMRDGGDLEPLA